MIAGLALLAACSPRGPTIQERFGDASYLTPIDAPPTVALLTGGELSTDVATCGSCHPENHAEWSQSAHAASVRDLQFSAELAKPGQPRWLCLNCHLPTRPQRAHEVRPETRLASEGVDRLVEAPELAFDAARVAEGIGCATCHVRRDADGAGVIIGPRGSGRAPHRVRRDPDALAGRCIGCHSPGPAVISATFVCWFETADEIAAGPRAGETCVGCHMPSVVRPPAGGAAASATRRHLWLGGGVPKTFDGYAWLEEVGWEPAIDVSVSLQPLAVTLTNARAAHAVPTADPERHLRVVVRAFDAQGVELERDVVRIGQEWDWGDEVTGRLAHRTRDTRLRPGETRVLTPELSLVGAARVDIEVTHVRLTTDNAVSMQRTELDAELVQLWPESPAMLTELPAHYPLETVWFRESWPLDGSAPTRTPRSALLREASLVTP